MFSDDLGMIAGKFDAPKPNQSRLIPFTKMHGLGNDYVYLDCTSSGPDCLPLWAQGNLADLAVAMSDRHRGVGGDGIILILPSKVADVAMRIFNADGSEAQMCGNGARCVAKYAWDNGIVKSPDFTIETLGGIRQVSLTLGAHKEVESVGIDMGAPVLVPDEIPFTGDVAESGAAALSLPEMPSVTIFPVSMGNPHGVVFVDSSVVNFPVEKFGPLLECAEVWPEKANIEFAHVVDRHTVEMRVWERGSGETQACGTGACATAVAAILSDRCASPVTVRLLGGDLKIEWDGCRSDSVRMEGPATTVMSGVYINEN